MDKDMPKPKDTDFPMHTGKKFVDKLVELEKIDEILTKQHNKDEKRWVR